MLILVWTKVQSSPHGRSWGTVLGTQYIIRYPHDILGYIGYGQCVATSSQDKYWYEHLREKGVKSSKTGNIKKLNFVDCNFPNIARDKFDKATTLLRELEAKYGYKANNWVEIYKKSPIMTFSDWKVMEEEFSQNLAGDVFYDYDIRNLHEYQVPIYYIWGRYGEWTSSSISSEYFDTITAPKIVPINCFNRCYYFSLLFKLLLTYIKPSHHVFNDKLHIRHR